MQVYLVRHGETFCNTHHIHQHEGVPLAEKGKEQAACAGRALAHLAEPHLVSSDLARARETADIIGKTLQREVLVDPLFREMRRPSSLFGKPYFGLFSLWVGLKLFLGSFFKSWHHSDEENLHDVTVRIERALAHLQSLAKTHEHVVVVSHAVFITLMLTCLRRGKISVFAYALGILKLFQVGNGSITHLSYECVGETCTWRIIEADNRAHLC